MTTRKTVILLTIILLLNLILVNADSGYYTEKNLLKACRCSTIIDNIKIKNTGTESTIYELTTNKDYIIIEPTKFELAKSEIQDINITINTPCKTQTTTISIRVNSNKGDNYQIKKELTTGQCNNLKARLYVEKQDVNPCEKINYKIKITNTGSFTENYTISSNYEEYMNFSTTKTLLKHDDQEEILVALKLPCNQYDTIPITFKVEAENNKLTANLQHDLQVNQQYNYNIKIPEEITICEEKPEAISFKIENEVKIPNTYKLKLEGAPKFVKLENKTITLDSKELKESTIKLNIKEGKQLGEYNFKLITSTEHGDLQQEKNITLNIIDCADIKLEIQPHEKTICAYGENIILKLKNDGFTNEILKITAEPNIINLQEQEIELEPNQEKNITIKLTPEDKNQEYDLIIKGTTKQGITTEAKTEINVLSKWTCHYVELNKHRYSIKKEKPEEIKIEIQNTKNIGGKYHLTLTPNKTVYLNQTTINLEPGIKKEITIIPNIEAETEFGTYNHNLTIKYKDFEYIKELTIKVKDKTIIEKLATYFYNKPCQLATTILLITAITLLLITIITKKKKGRIKGKTITITIITLILLQTILGLAIYSQKGIPRIQEPINHSKINDTYYTWRQGSNYEISINKLVSDPDTEDKIELSINNPPEEITLTTTEEQAIFESDKEWHGTKKIILIATDSKGSTAKSPEITIEVIEKKEYTPSSFYNQYCWHINWLILLTCFLLLTIVSTKKMRTEIQTKKIKKKKSKKRKKR